MKRLLSLVLVLTMVLCIPTFCFAADTDSEAIKKSYFDYMCNFYDYGVFDADRISYTDCGNYNGYQMLWFNDSYPSTYSDMGIYAGQYYFEGSIKIFPTNEYKFIEPMLAYKNQKIYNISSLVYKGELNEQDLAELNLYVKYTSRGIDAFYDSSLDYVLRKLENESVEILEYSGQSEGGYLKIPEEIDTFKVGAIGPYFIPNPAYNSFQYLYIPAGVSVIDKNAFINKHFSTPFVSVIYGIRGSYAEQYASNHGFVFLEPGEFSDVPRNAWYYDAVRFCFSEGIIKGKSALRFSPAEKIERQDFVIMLARLSGENFEQTDTEAVSRKFSDVGRQSYYSAALAWAVNNGFIKGYENGKFGVGDPITREQMMTVLYRFFDEGVPQTAEKSLDGFFDKEMISNFALEGAAWCVTNNIIKGKSDTVLAPMDNATRAEAATVFMRLLKHKMDFTDDCVIVVLTHEYGNINMPHTADEFPGVDIAEITDLTHIEGDPHEKEYLNLENFRQILKLTLTRPGKGEVLKAVRALKKLPYVESASPNYISYMD